MMRRAAIASVFVLSFAGATFVGIAPARAQHPAQDAAASVAPDETACANATLGSDCQSSTSGGGGTCLGGCCCHYVTTPEGAQVCQPCLACSDTSNTDPAFAPGPCSDGGAVPDDAGVVAIVDAGVPIATPTTPTATPPPSNGCTCSSVGARTGVASGVDRAALRADPPSLAAFLFGAVLLGRARTRTRKKPR